MRHPFPLAWFLLAITTLALARPLLGHAGAAFPV